MSRPGAMVMVRLAVVAAVASLIQAAAASAAVDPVPIDRAPSSSKLSSALDALAQPGVRTASRAERARMLSLPATGPGSLVQRGEDVVVDVRARTTSAGQVEALRSAGARVLHVAGDLRTVTVAVAAQELRALAAVPGVENVSPELKPITAGLSGAAGSGAACQGAVTSEADTQLRAAEARDTFGISGAGVEIGVLSDSYDVNATDTKNAADDVASGDLPGPGNPCGRTTPVDVVAEGAANGSDEGRGMAQLVHDIAPDASLAFATAGPATAFPDRLQALRTGGADVLVDDVTWLDEPFFQPGPQSVAVGQARAAGVGYFSSAANFNLILGGQDRASWEAPGWRATSCPDSLAQAQLQACMNFAGPTEEARAQLPFRLQPGGRLTIDLQWAEPWYGVDSDIDAFLLRGDQPVAASQDANPGPTGTQKPFEAMGVRNASSNPVDLSLVIGRYSGPDPSRLKFALIDGDIQSIGAAAPQDGFGPTIFGHNAAPGGMSVAAVPFSDSQQVEPFSSRGPVTHYFGPVEGTTPAEPLAEADTMAKPDIAATDGAATTYFGSPWGDAWRFFGTSAAAPHAAAVAALAMDAAPGATLAQVYDAMLGTAAPVGAFEPSAQGAGLVDAYAAVERVATPIGAEDSYQTNEDESLSVPAPGVVGNDSDPGGDGVTATLESDPGNGDLTLNADGSFSYAPDANFSGRDSFSYRAIHGDLESGPVTVTIDVLAVNDAPAAAADSYIAAEQLPLEVAGPGVLANDSDVDGDTLSAHVTSGPAHGNLTLDSDGGFVYQSDPDFNGRDGFSYRADDGDLESDEVTVTIDVAAVNDATSALDDAYVTTEDTQLSVDEPGVLGNDSDPDGDSLTASVESGPRHGTLHLDLNGSLTYTPDPDFNGIDTFEYRAAAGPLDWAIAIVTIEVGAVNDAPEAAADAYETEEDTPLRADAPGVLGNDTDTDGDALTAALVVAAGHGRVELEDDGSFSYTPDPDFAGSDSFTYRARDGGLASDPVTVDIEVGAVEDPPPAGPHIGEAPPTAAVAPPPTAAVAPPVTAGAEAAISDLRLDRRCVRRSRAGRVRVQMSMRLARPGAVRVDLDRVVGRAGLRGCPAPTWTPRNGLRHRRVATVRRARTQAAAVDRSGLTLNPRLRPGLYRVSVRAHLDAGRLSPPVHGYLRVLG